MSYNYLDKTGLERVKEKIDAKISFDSDSIHTTTVQEFGEAFGEAFNQALEEKQDTLVSGTNIKTINSESILGEGNIDVEKTTYLQATIGYVEGEMVMPSEWIEGTTEENYHIIDNCYNNKQKVMLRLKGVEPVANLQVDLPLSFVNEDKDEEDNVTYQYCFSGTIQILGVIITAIVAEDYYLVVADPIMTPDDVKEEVEIGENEPENDDIELWVDESELGVSVETDPVFAASPSASITNGDITNWNGKSSNSGTVTGVKLNGITRGFGGVVDLGDVLTEHQPLKTINGETITGTGNISLPVTGSGMIVNSQSGYNCNTCYDAGLYQISNGSNMPNGEKYGSLLVLTYRKATGNTYPDYCCQIFMSNGDSSASRNSLFFRTGWKTVNEGPNGTGWNDWQEITNGSQANNALLGYGQRSNADDIKSLGEINTFDNGTRQNSSGGITGGTTNYKISDMIPVWKGDIIRYRLSGSSGDGLLCTFNNSKSFQSCISEGSGWDNYISGTYTVTMDAGYVRICYPKARVTDYKFEVERHTSLSTIAAQILNSSNKILKLYDSSDTIQKLKNLVWQSRLHGWDKQQPKPFMFLHFTDIHVPTNSSSYDTSVTPLYRMMEFYKYYQNYFQEILHSGDTAYDSWNDGVNYWNNVSGSENILNCLGNHDINNLPDGTTKTDVYNRYFSSIVNWNVSQPSNAQSEGKMYYYKDYTNTSSTNITSKMRLVVLDSSTVTTGDTAYANAQATWFRGVLEAARQDGRAVMVMYHHAPKYDHFERCAFDSIVNNESITSNFDQIYREIDDFIDAGGEFIMHLVGHTHYDCCGTVANTDTLTLRNKQIIYAGTLSSWSHTQWGIQYRNDDDESIDGFTAISVNTIDKKITFARFGSKYDMFMQRKDRMCLDYNDAKVVYSS